MFGTFLAIDTADAAFFKDLDERGRRGESFDILGGRWKISRSSSETGRHDFSGSIIFQRLDLVREEP